MNPRWTKEQLNKVKQLHAQGHDDHSIADLMQADRPGVTATTIGKVRSYHKLGLHRKGKRGASRRVKHPVVKPVSVTKPNGKQKVGQGQATVTINTDNINATFTVTKDVAVTVLGMLV